MTIEEKSRGYADAMFKEFLPKEILDNPHRMLAERKVPRFDSYYVEQAYEDGYTEALASQWKDPKVEMPEDGEWVIIVAGEDDVQTAVWNEIHQCWDDDEGDDVKYEKDVVTLWMPIPEPPEKGGEA